MAIEASDRLSLTLPTSTGVFTALEMALTHSIPRFAGGFFILLTNLKMLHLLNKCIENPKSVRRGWVFNLTKKAVIMYLMALLNFLIKKIYIILLHFLYYLSVNCNSKYGTLLTHY